MSTAVREDPRRRLTLARAALLAEAACGLLAARVLVATLPFAAVARLWRLEPGPSARGGPAPATAEAAAWAVAAAAWRLPWTATCLDRALVGAALLARRGVPATVHLGARLLEGRRLVAHAWLTVGDRVLLGGDDPHACRPVACFHRPRRAADA